MQTQKINLNQASLDPDFKIHRMKECFFFNTFLNSFFNKFTIVVNIT